MLLLSVRQGSWHVDMLDRAPKLHLQCDGCGIARATLDRAWRERLSPNLEEPIFRGRGNQPPNLSTRVFTRPVSSSSCKIATIGGFRKC